VYASESIGRFPGRGRAGIGFQRTGQPGRRVSLFGRTDYLIDQIVYQLYGLTEEEIAIVEGEG
jgi:hypothetical protein